MSSHDEIRLRSTENGWVGVDPETGEEVPVPFEALQAESSRTKEERQHISAEWFNDEDSVTAGIQEAHDFAVDQGYERIVIEGPPGTHYCHHSARFEIDVILDGASTTLKFPDEQQERPLDQDVASTDRTIYLSDTDDLEPGYELIFYDDSGELKYGHGSRGTIESVSSNSVTLEESLGSSYSTANNAVAVHAFYGVIYNADAGGTGEVRDLDIDGNDANYDGPTGNNAHWVATGVQASGTTDSKGTTFQNVTVTDIAGAGLGAHGTNGIIKGCRVIRAAEGVHNGLDTATVTESYFEDCTVGYHSSTNLWGQRIENNEFRRCGQAVEGLSTPGTDATSSPPDDRFIVANNYFEDTKGQVLHTNNDPRNITFADNIVYNANTEQNLGQWEASVATLYRGMACKITGNVIIDEQQTSTTYKTAAIYVNEPEGSVTVEDNLFRNWGGDNSNDYAIYAYGDSAGNGHVDIRDNTAKGEFGRFINLDNNGTLVDNTHYGATGGTSYRLRDGVVDRVIVSNNVADPSAGWSLDSGFQPTRVTISDNLPEPKVDVRTLGATDTNLAYHDGSGTGNPEGPARHIGGSWTSMVDGTAIS